MLDRGSILGRSTILGGIACGIIASIGLGITGGGRGGCGSENTAGGLVEIYRISCGFGTDRR